MSIDLKNIVIGVISAVIVIAGVYEIGAHQPSPSRPAEITSNSAQLKHVAIINASLAGALKANHAALVTAGKPLFLANCAGCHEADGSGGVGPVLQNNRHTPLRITQIIYNGKGGMPSFASKLDSNQEAAIAEYVLTLRKK